MKKYIVTNLKKGIILEAANVDEAKKLGNREFYSPFRNEHGLTTIQVYEPNNHLFVSASGNRNFEKVQFHFTGDGSGVTTSYNCNIDTLPTENQLKFIGTSEIYNMTFTN